MSGQTPKGYPFKRVKLALGDLRVHATVQRALKPKWAADIASNFDESALDDLWVSRAHGKYYIFDGQHRFEGLKMYLGKGWEVVEVWCRVYDNLDVPSLAKLTGAKNDHLNWTAIAEFRREVLAEDTVAVEISKLLKGFGLIVREDTSPGTVRAVGALRQVYNCKPNGPAVLTWTIALLHGAWPNDPTAMHQNLIRGTGIFCQKHAHKIDRDALQHRLTAHETADLVLGQARAFARATGVSVPHGVVQMLVRAYNTGRRGGKIGDADSEAA